MTTEQVSNNLKVINERADDLRKDFRHGLLTAEELDKLLWETGLEVGICKCCEEEFIGEGTLCARCDKISHDAIMDNFDREREGEAQDYD